MIAQGLAQHTDGIAVQVICQIDAMHEGTDTAGCGLDMERLCCCIGHDFDLPPADRFCAGSRFVVLHVSEACLTQVH